MTQQLRRYGGWAIIVALQLLAVEVRFRLVDFATLDMMAFLIPWLDFIRANGGYRALGYEFSNYAPAYTYLLAIASYLPAWIDDVARIKTISMIFDLVAAVVMYKLVRLKYPSGSIPWIAYFAVLFAPTVVINSAYWGQADMVYAVWLLACIYYVCINRPLLAMLCFGLAFAFKAQAAFLSPFILLLLLRRRIPWRYIVVPPLVYAALILPCALLGRPVLDLLTIYLEQAASFPRLSMNAPNLYALLPDSVYRAGLVGGLVLAGVGGLAVALLELKRRVPLSREFVLLSATLSAALMPFLLPKMHDRYFFPADLISIGLAFYQPQLWFVPLIFQATSLIAYSSYALGRPVLPLYVASIANTLIIGLLLWVYVRKGTNVIQHGPQPSTLQAGVDLSAG